MCSVGLAGTLACRRIIHSLPCCARSLLPSPFPPQTLPPRCSCVEGCLHCLGPATQQQLWNLYHLRWDFEEVHQKLQENMIYPQTKVLLWVTRHSSVPGVVLTVVSENNFTVVVDKPGAPTHTDTDVKRYRLKRPVFPEVCTMYLDPGAVCRDPGFCAWSKSCPGVTPSPLRKLRHHSQPRPARSIETTRRNIAEDNTEGQSNHAPLGGDSADRDGTSSSP